MRIYKQQSHMIQVHTGRYPFIVFQFFPRLFHLCRIMDIVQHDYPFLPQTRQECVHVAQSRLISMVGIHIRHIQTLARVIN